MFQMHYLLKLNFLNPNTIVTTRIPAMPCACDTRQTSKSARRNFHLLRTASHVQWQRRTAKILLCALEYVWKCVGSSNTIIEHGSQCNTYVKQYKDKGTAEEMKICHVPWITHTTKT
jgi:hypothetical protein